MAYRRTVLHTQVGDDSNLSNVDYDRTAVIDQSQDQQVFNTMKTVNPTDGEMQVPIAPVVNGYYVEIRSDRPVMVRVNGNAATQFTMKPNNVQPVNPGTPAPDACIFAASISCTSIYLAPVAGASLPAKVKIVVTGDPTAAYA